MHRICCCLHHRLLGEVPHMARQSLSSSRICVQATECIVQFAMLTRKPFAVVPCCVFPETFKERSWKGLPVRKYEDFISYLVALDPEHIQVEELMFEGRNKCVFATGWGLNDRSERPVRVHLLEPCRQYENRET